MANGRSVLHVGILMLLALIWGSSYILMKRGLEGFSPMEVACLRTLFASLVLLPLTGGRLRRIPRRDWTWVAVVGIVGSGIPSFLYPLSVQGIGSALPGIINALTPLFTLAAGALLFGVALTGRKLAGVALGLAGALVLMLLRSAGDVRADVLYTGCSVLATISYGYSTNVLKTHLTHLPALLVTSATFAVIAVPAAVLFVVVGGLDTLRAADASTWRALGFVAMLGIVGTAMALVLFNRLIQHTSALFATSVTYLMPFIALLWGAADGEEITLVQLIGLALILAGILLIRAGNRGPAVSRPS